MANVKSYESLIGRLSEPSLIETPKNILLTILLAIVLGLLKDSVRAQDETHDTLVCSDYLLPEKLTLDFPDAAPDLINTLADKGCRLQQLITHAISAESPEQSVAEIMQAQEEYLSAFQQVNGNRPEMYRVLSAEVLSELLRAIKQAKQVPEGRVTSEDLTDETVCEQSLNGGGTDECNWPTLITVRDPQGQVLYEAWVSNTVSVEDDHEVITQVIHQIVVNVGAVTVVFLTPGFVDSQNLAWQISQGTFTRALYRDDSVTGILLGTIMWTG